PTINAFEQMYWEEGPDPVLMVSAQTTSTIINVQEIVRLCTIGPNPTEDGVVTISAGRDVIKYVRVYDMAGNLIDSRSPNSTRTQTRLPAQAGGYLIEVVTTRGRSLERVIRR
ncbi:MAG: T9SS type A sorting domain-containing protein, partial [Flavobacteriales bacterium]